MSQASWYNFGNWACRLTIFQLRTWRFGALLSWTSSTSTDCVFTLFFGGHVDAFPFDLSAWPWPFQLTSGMVFDGNISASWKLWKINICEMVWVDIFLASLLLISLISEFQNRHHLTWMAPHWRRNSKSFHHLCPYQHPYHQHLVCT